MSSQNTGFFAISNAALHFYFAINSGSPYNSGKSILIDESSADLPNIFLYSSNFLAFPVTMDIYCINNLFKF